MSSTLDALVSQTYAAFAPPPLLSVSAWADLERVLPDTSAEPGRWHTSRTPYLAGIMDAVLEPAARHIVVMKAHQLGGSEALNNVVGYHIAHDPCGILLALPTIELAEDYAKNNLEPMIASTHALAARVPSGRGPGAESTLRLKRFTAGFLALAGANSATSFRRRAVRLFIGDDVDGWGPPLRDEGDQVELGMNRTTTFWNGRTILVSTPTIRGGRMDAWYQRSDQRRYFVPCPQCARMDYWTWNTQGHIRVVYDEHDPATARLECPAPEQGGCGAVIDNAARGKLLARGEWRATATAKEAGLVGFHVWAAYSPWVSLQALVARWLSTQGRGREALRVFVNTMLGEPFEEQTYRVEPGSLLGRRQSYGEGIEAPERVGCLVAGVDTQDDRFEVLVLGFGPGEEKWVLDWHTVPGDPKLPETKASLREVLDRKYHHALGVDLPIHAVMIDSGGHRTDEVYQFVLAHQHRRIAAIIGRSGLRGKPIVSTGAAKRWGDHPRPVPLYTVNTDDAKTTLLSSLGYLEPIPGAGAPGVWHFPLEVDERFFAQLTAEQLETHHDRKTGIAIQYWVQIRDNHALDCAVYAYAAFRWLNPNVSQMLARIREAAGQRAAAATAVASGAPAPPDPPRPPASIRRAARSGYLTQ
jgi:phage terminase large subunit GpA-like protein